MSPALKYLEKALQVSDTLDGQPEILEIKANIFVNLSSVHSFKGEHDIALNYCSKAISILVKLYNKIILRREKQEDFEEKESSDTKVMRPSYL